MDNESSLIKKLVESYDIGKLISYKRMPRPTDVLKPDSLQHVFIIKTTHGKYFLKRFKSFDYYARKSLELIKSLEKKNSIKKFLKD